MKRHHIKWAIIAALAAVLLMTLVLLARPAVPVRVTMLPVPTAAIYAAPTVSPETSPQSTQPKITWSPTSVEVILSPGETSTKNFTFSSDQYLANAVIEPVPALAGFLNLQPNSFANVLANQPQAVQLKFAIPGGAAFGIYDGTIHVRVGTQTFPQTLKVVINTWSSFSDTLLGVSVKFPPGFAIDNANSYIGPNQRPGPGFLSSKSLYLPNSPGYLTIAMYSNDGTLPLLEWFNQVLRGHEFTGSELEPATDGVTNIRSITTAGFPALEVTGETMGDVQKRIFIAKQNLIVELMTSYATWAEEPEDIKRVLTTVTLF